MQLPCVLWFWNFFFFLCVYSKQNHCFFDVTFCLYVGTAKSALLRRLLFSIFSASLFFPISILFLISIHYATKSRKAKHIIAAVAWASIALSLFCNFESGIICIIVFAGYVILQKAYLYTFGDPKIWKTIFAQIFCAIISILIFICTVQLITYLRSGQALGINDCFLEYWHLRAQGSICCLFHLDCGLFILSCLFMLCIPPCLNWKVKEWAKNKLPIHVFRPHCLCLQFMDFVLFRIL